MSVQLNASNGHNAKLASELASLTSSCTVEACVSTTPAAYEEAINTVGSAGLTSTESDVPSAVGPPLIYMLLELGTFASLDKKWNAAL